MTFCCRVSVVLAAAFNVCLELHLEASHTNMPTDSVGFQQTLVLCHLYPGQAPAKGFSLRCSFYVELKRDCHEHGPLPAPLFAGRAGGGVGEALQPSGHAQRAGAHCSLEAVVDTFATTGAC